MDEDFDIQTRSEETGLCYYTTLKEAVQKADRDPTVWKISFSIASGERVRLLRREPTFWDRIFFWREAETEWVYSPI